MRNHFIVGGIMVALLWQTGTASAQMAPRRSFSGNRGGGYYSYDPVFYPDINQTNAAYMQVANQRSALQAQAATQRTSAWQNINSSLAQQADMRTQSMLAQRQSAKDWWYDIESRKLAESRARQSYSPTSLPYTPSADPSAAVPQKPAVPEIMIWPTLLKGSEFGALRGKVEAPFRRALADKKPLTADDYRGILQAIAEMKTMLKGMSSQVIESEYASVEAYLDELSTDAQKRLDARLSPKTATEKTEKTESKP